MKRKKMLTILAAIIAAPLLTGCGFSPHTTAADQEGLHYDGGPFAGRGFKECVNPGQKVWYGPGDKLLTYPLGQRTYDATGGKDAERGAIVSVSQDSVEMSTRISVTFNLKTDCKTLRKFHEQVGIKYKASMNDDEISDGWKKMLDFYIGQSLETTLDREEAAHSWRDLYNKPEVRLALQNSIDQDLPDLVKSKMGDVYFDNFSAQVQKPDVTNDALKQAIADNQNNIASAQAAKAKAEADLATAQAQIALQQAQAQKTKADISAYGTVDDYNKNQAIQKGINPYQPTYVVSGTAPSK